MREGSARFRGAARRPHQEPRLVAYGISDRALAGTIRSELVFQMRDCRGSETGEQAVAQRGGIIYRDHCRDRCRGRKRRRCEGPRLHRFLQPHRWVQARTRCIARISRGSAAGDSFDTRLSFARSKAVAEGG